MSKLFELLEYSRQAHQQKQQRVLENAERNALVVEQGRLARIKYARVGSRRLYYMAGISAVGINQFESLMSGAGLTVQPLRRQIHGTDSRGHKHKYPNLLYGGYELCDVNELVVSDLTYFKNESGLYYICLQTDVYSQRIVGYSGAKDKRSLHAIKALEMTIKLRGKASMECTIHHSDYGSEYRSDEYIKILLDHKMQISMAASCLENAYAERRNGTIKNDFLLYSESTIGNLCQLRKALDIAIYRYNHEVVQAKLGYRTPAMYEAWIASLPPAERPRKQLYNFEQGVSKKS